MEVSFLEVDMKDNKMRKKRIFNIKLKPTQILVLGFLGILVIGTILLNLPISSVGGKSIGIIDALFTATSSVCVTGLVVVNTMEHWTMFGKTVILILIQIGGLGFMSFTTALFIIMGRKITLKERLVIQEAFNQYTLAGMVKLTINILIGTFIVEGVGALLLSIRFIPKYGIGMGVFMSVFHSVSAFCNAGFDIIGHSSLTPYVSDVLFNFTIMMLIILGGLGFAVWLNIVNVSRDKIENQYSMKRWFSKLTLHTKLVLVLSGFLIGVGFVFFFIVEYNNPDTFGNMTLSQKILAALFQSVTPRTAGFNTIPLDKLKEASKFMTILYMFVGGSPGGTAGGVKTVTVGVILLTVKSVMEGKERTEIFSRSIPTGVIRKATAVIAISLGVVVGVTMLLSLSEPDSIPFMDIFFEATSAFATVGLSVGITGSLSTFGKIIIAITMFIGRLGPVTMVAAFTLKGKRRKGSIKKPEERVMVG